MQGLKFTLINTLITATLLSASVAVHAEGMAPETSLLIIDEAIFTSGTINVKNTDSHLHLYTNVVDLPDDTGLKFIATQPAVRLEPGQTQQLRFILQNKQLLEAAGKTACRRAARRTAALLVCASLSRRLLPANSSRNQPRRYLRETKPARDITPAPK